MTHITVSHQSLALPVDVFLAQVIGGVSTMKGVRVERPSPTNVTIHHRYTPGWAVFFGIVGLFVFLIGAFLFFIKRTDTLSVIADEVPGGCVVSISGSGSEGTVMLLNRLVGGEAEKNYAAALAGDTL